MMSPKEMSPKHVTKAPIEATVGKSGQSTQSYSLGRDYIWVELALGRRTTKRKTGNRWKPTMIRLVMAIVTAAVLGCGPVYSQAISQAIAPTSPLSVGPGSPVGTGSSNSSSPGTTSPLGTGPGSPVGSVGIPMGAMELPTPGESPLTSGASPPVSSGATGGATGGAMGRSSSRIGSPSSSGSSTGPVGIPLGATEMSPGGLSPLNPPVPP
jgi:hypothetical protein